jgi:nitrogenase molybdenum-iron protein alpha/beta subunit
MTLKPSPSNSCRSGGCTLTGALSVTTHVRDAVSVVHGPKGCTHHNFSLLHATCLDNDNVVVPALVSSAMTETDVVFGGEQALYRTLNAVRKDDPSAIFVLSACIVDTIGDDVGMVCRTVRGVPVIPVPTAGFLGGSFQNGVNNALIALAGMADGGKNASARNRYSKGSNQPAPSVNIIGEKNLEYEVDENYAEVSRLLSALGIPVNVRFVHDLPLEEIALLPGARLNILRDPALVPVGEILKKRFGMPYLLSFPFGISANAAFLESVGDACGVPYWEVVAGEQELQNATLAEFADIEGSHISFEKVHADDDCIRSVRTVARVLKMRVKKGGRPVPLPATAPVGITGMRRMLHRWRCAINA